MKPTFYEFFAGGGMARLGLGPGWECLFANDFSRMKALAYLSNFPGMGPRFKLGDVAELTVAELPGEADLVWGSFPCQDLSVAGNGAGLAGSRSGAFWPFWGLIQGLVREGRAPSIVVIENVEGTLTSHGGADFRALVQAVTDAGFIVGGLTMDAVRFLPQSRARLFLVAVRSERAFLSDVQARSAVPIPSRTSVWRSTALQAAYQALPGELQEKWIWWHLPEPPLRRSDLRDLLEPDDQVEWNTPDETGRLLQMMSEVNLSKVARAQLAGNAAIGCVYKRTRDHEQRAEVRFDGISGCLRTPGGGSSRQTIMKVCPGGVRSRLLAAREAARLMGIPDTYSLPAAYNDAYHLAGDGVAVPVVGWLERHLLRPLAEAAQLNIVPADHLRSDVEVHAHA